MRLAGFVLAAALSHSAATAAADPVGLEAEADGWID